LKAIVHGMFATKLCYPTIVCSQLTQEPCPEGREVELI